MPAWLILSLLGSGEVAEVAFGTAALLMLYYATKSKGRRR